ncbi:MAG: hypothetical protein NUV58_04355 [Candidatus Roizmanbacteria bacterium]|nr:hypothetical protein [Candidatus Roizmanbacteria bacterium]
METNVILPVLNTEDLQKKANEYAQKGAEDALKEFYTGYNSPYKKALEASLMNKGVDSAIEIPDIIGILNDSISAEIDMIANNAVSKSFVPMVKRFLTRSDAELKLSDILKEFIEFTDFKDNDDAEIDDYSMEVKKDDGSFLYLKITNSKVTYELSFYQKSKNGETPKVYEIYTLPSVADSSGSYRNSSIPKTMKLSIDGVTLEMPFTPKVLEDNFISYVAKLVIANTKITFDVKEFSEDMFPENEHCHCD